MANSQSPFAYSDVQQLLDRAIESARGVKIKFGNRGRAFNFLQRLYSFRRLDRQKNAKIYPEDHPMHGNSIYDVLAFSRRNESEIHVTRRTLDSLEVEEL